jgi:hypothetical protein
MKHESPRPSRREFLKRSVAAGASWAGLTAAGRALPRADRRALRWLAHSVAKIPQGYQVAVADVNGDGRLDILALSSEESIVEWYEAPAWKPHPITARTKGNISLAPLRRPGGNVQRGLALATDFALEQSTQGGSLWWAETGPAPTQEWRLALVGQIPTSHRLRWADIDGDGRLELIDAPIIGPGAAPPDYSVGAPLTWFEVPPEIEPDHPSSSRLVRDRWPSHLIDDTLTVVHGITVLDWDDDGRGEILTANFEGVHLFHSTGFGENLRWTKVHLAAGDQPGKTIPAGGAGNASGGTEIHRGSSEIGVGKLNGRRFLATIEPWHGEQVVVYTADEHAQPRKLWDRHVIDDTLRDGHALVCADLDGDGNDEIVAGFRGPGTSLHVYTAADPSGTHWERQTLDTEMATSCVTIADLNGDGRLDVVAIGASTGNVKWYENLGLRD